MTDKAAAYIATGLAMATIFAAMGVMKARAEQQQPSYLIIGTSEDVFRTQAIHIVKYPNGMSECAEALRVVKLMKTGPSVLITLVPFCTDVKPVFWVE